MLEMWLCEVRLVTIGELAGAMSTLEIQEWGPELRASTASQTLTQEALTWFTQVWSRVLLYVTFVFIVCRCLIQTREHYWLPLAGQELLRVFWTLLALILFFSTVE